MANPIKILCNTLAPVLILPLLMVGCSLPSDQYHPQYATYVQAIRSVLLLSPQIAVLQEKPDGTSIWHAQASEEATRLAEQEVRNALESKRLTVHTTGPVDDPQARDVLSLYSAVNRAIQLHVFGPQIFPHKIESFEYDLGSVENLLARQNADALVLVIGHQVLSAPQSQNWISIAVVAPTGSIVWYHLEKDKQNLGMQTEATMRALVENALRNFMGGAR